VKSVVLGDRVDAVDRALGSTVSGGCRLRELVLGRGERALRIGGIGFARVREVLVLQSLRGIGLGRRQMQIVATLLVCTVGCFRRGACECECRRRVGLRLFQHRRIRDQRFAGRTVACLRLAEISILMPARLTKIGFGKNSLSLYEAVKQLTGLDQLSDIAEGCTAFGAANRKFMKYSKDQGIESYEHRFATSITHANS